MQNVLFEYLQKLCLHAKWWHSHTSVAGLLSSAGLLSLAKIWEFQVVWPASDVIAGSWWSGLVEWEESAFVVEIREELLMDLYYQYSKVMYKFDCH